MVHLFTTTTAVKRAWIEIEADGDVSSEEIYKIAAEKINKSRNVKWEEPTLNIIEINIDDEADANSKVDIKLLKAINPILNNKS